MLRSVLHIYLLHLSVAVIMGCGKEFSCEDCINKPPQANAGDDKRLLLPVDKILLDGTASSDPDGKIVEWKWTIINGLNAKITDETNSKAVLLNPPKGLYELELRIKDNAGAFGADTIIISVDSNTNRPPIALAGADQEISDAAQLVKLDGSASWDPDNNIQTYLWYYLSGPTTPAISSSASAMTEVSNLKKGDYQFILVVTDSFKLVSRDTINIRMNVNISTCNSGSRPLIRASLTEIGELSVARLGMAVASTGNKILFAGGGIGGLADVDILDISSGKWSKSKLSAARWGIGVVTAGDLVFFAGGESGNGTMDKYYQNVDIYNAATDSWTIQYLFTPRSQVAAATIGTKVYFAGGELTGGASTTSDVDVYDLVTGHWSTVQLSEPRSYITPVTTEDRIYFAGGTGDSRSFKSITKRIDVYNDVQGEWTTQELMEPRAFMAGLYANDKIYWAGGQHPDSNAYYCSVEIHDLISKRNDTKYLSENSAWWIDGGQNAAIKGDKIIFFGAGFLGGFNRFDIYDMSTGNWSIGELPYRIQGCSIIAVQGKIYLAGGFINDVLSAKVWLLDF